MVGHLVPLILFLATLAHPVLSADISVRIERHFPCSASSGPKKENLLIKFPSYKTAGVEFHEETNAQGHKCFRMSGGKVEVFPPGLSGSKKYYVHLETRIGIHGKPERCVNADSNGCGGIGSCVHCDICQTMGGSLKNFVQIFQGNKPAQCSSQRTNRRKPLLNLKISFDFCLMVLRQQMRQPTQMIFSKTIVRGNSLCDVYMKALSRKPSELIDPGIKIWGFRG
ncbi:hypothetical protein Y032_0013g2151 [Ancylostoma ceylanicum]|uniref:Netrin module non-TIMP type domain-containing protein n=1 Tax=Ancylostoma ceylanicum TaxID=53326 RepID=A0A016VBQ9_9BILA|nr:hypothetical protein Y032_0013g2151 [Ancylostoma ceylanicum]